VSGEAVRADSEDTLVAGLIADALGRVSCPVDMLRAERGMLNEPGGLFPDAVVAEWLSVVNDLGVVPDTNHYTILFAEHGAAAVADAIRKAVAAA
jgi:hypothetical protein